VVATFCLRLAAGLLLMLPLLPSAQIPPRFYRVHFLTALGLLAVVAAFVFERADVIFWLIFGAAVVVCVIGSIVWHLDEAPGGRGIALLGPAVVTACLIYGGVIERGDSNSPWRAADDVCSALVVGSAITAMLMGHSYLIAPAMTIAPLMRLLAVGACSVILRIGLACVGLWGWTSSRGAGNLDTELLLWLSVRWALGLIAPLVLGWMAWETARIRSTQSATGILYVVVIVCFLGELTSLLLVEKTGVVL
jgi:hypothetical protein